MCLVTCIHVYVQGFGSLWRYMIIHIYTLTDTYLQPTHIHVCIYWINWACYKLLHLVPVIRWRVVNWEKHRMQFVCSVVELCGYDHIISMVHRSTAGAAQLRIFTSIHQETGYKTHNCSHSLYKSYHHIFPKTFSYSLHMWSCLVHRPDTPSTCSTVEHVW